MVRVWVCPVFGEEDSFRSDLFCWKHFREQTGLKLVRRGRKFKEKTKFNIDVFEPLSRRDTGKHGAICLSGSKKKPHVFFSQFYINRF